MAALIPEPHILLIVVAPAVLGIPAPIAACLAGACPIPAGRTHPITTSSISSGLMLAFLIAPFIAILPKSGAFSVDKLPWKLPIGVLAIPVITICSLFIILLLNYLH